MAGNPLSLLYNSQQAVDVVRGPKLTILLIVEAYINSVVCHNLLHRDNRDPIILVFQTKVHNLNVYHIHAYMSIHTMLSELSNSNQFLLGLSKIMIMYKLLPQSKSHVNDDFSFPASPQLPPPECLQDAIFAAGSFWELEAAFDRVNGVVRTATGYYGGSLVKPSCREVLERRTGHTEAVRVIFDNRKTSFKSLCRVFWASHDHTNKEYLNFGVSTHYRSAIFYVNEEEKKQAQESKIEHQMKLSRRIVTKISPRPSSGAASTFFLAETHHQKYYLQRDHIRLCECLSLRSAQQFVDSHLACKLNGILSRDRKDAAVKDLQKFLTTYQLTHETKLALEAIIQELVSSNKD